MKQRQDFVTNSSSSSFVIILKNNVTEQQINDFLYQNSIKIDEVCNETGQVSREVMQDLKNMIVNFKGKEIGDVKVRTYHGWTWEETPENLLQELSLPDWILIQ